MSLQSMSFFCQWDQGRSDVRNNGEKEETRRAEQRHGETTEELT